MVRQFHDSYVSTLLLISSREEKRQKACLRSRQFLEYSNSLQKSKICIAALPLFPYQIYKGKLKLPKLAVEHLAFFNIIISTHIFNEYLPNAF